jgi:hypothetical protein
VTLKMFKSPAEVFLSFVELCHFYDVRVTVVMINYVTFAYAARTCSREPLPQTVLRVKTARRRRRIDDMDRQETWCEGCIVNAGKQ